MIITCPSCEKKFEVESNLIPEKGRLLKCGSCEQTWFFKKNSKSEKVEPNIKKDNDTTILKKNKEINHNIDITNTGKKDFSKNENQKKTALIKYEKKSIFSFKKFLFLIIVFIITFTGILIIVDTFQTFLFDIFPRLEIILFNFYETLKDINLFIKDLVL